MDPRFTYSIASIGDGANFGFGGATNGVGDITDF